METDKIRQLRIDLAAAFRWAARLGFHEGVCNHFSVMLAPDRFLINAHRTHWAKARASELLVIDDSGNTIEGEGRPATTGTNIHVPMHRMTGHKVILHTHMPYATALTCIEGGRLENARVHDEAVNGIREGRVAWTRPLVTGEFGQRRRGDTTLSGPGPGFQRDQLRRRHIIGPDGGEVAAVW